MGGAGSATPRMLGVHPSPYESRAAAASVGLGAPPSFQGAGGVQASEVATPGAGLHGMREGGGGAPIARNAHDVSGVCTFFYLVLCSTSGYTYICFFWTWEVLMFSST